MDNNNSYICYDNIFFFLVLSSSRFTNGMCTVFFIRLMPRLQMHPDINNYLAIFWAYNSAFSTFCLRLNTSIVPNDEFTANIVLCASKHWQYLSILFFFFLFFRFLCLRSLYSLTFYIYIYIASEMNEMSRAKLVIMRNCKLYFDYS